MKRKMEESERTRLGVDEEVGREVLRNQVRTRRNPNPDAQFVAGMDSFTTQD